MQGYSSTRSNSLMVCCLIQHRIRFLRSPINVEYKAGGMTSFGIVGLVHFSLIYEHFTGVTWHVFLCFVQKYQTHHSWLFLACYNVQSSPQQNSDFMLPIFFMKLNKSCSGRPPRQRFLGGEGKGILGLSALLANWKPVYHQHIQQCKPQVESYQCSGQQNFAKRQGQHY